MPNQIIAAGGLVTNPNGQLLWIFRRGFWDLPKGKLDEGETIQTCAIREVQEETGLRNIQLHELLKFTNHLYFDKYLNEEVTKRTYWFHMTIREEQKGIPQITEDIEKIEWHSLATAKHCLQQTYPTILEVIEAYRIKINEL
ncbi:MAG: NUDIX domain-containing protein [Bacteroidetes bacterium]|nr:NUDIX domain-containing protein [Bacteroidota bacterium]